MDSVIRGGINSLVATLYYIREHAPICIDVFARKTVDGRLQVLLEIYKNPLID